MAPSLFYPLANGHSSYPNHIVELYPSCTTADVSCSCHSVFPHDSFPKYSAFELWRVTYTCIWFTSLVFPGLFQIQEILLVDVTIPNYLLLWLKSWSAKIFWLFSNNALVTLMTGHMFHGHQYSVVLLSPILLHLSISRFLYGNYRVYVPIARTVLQYAQSSYTQV